MQTLILVAFLKILCEKTSIVKFFCMRVVQTVSVIACISGPDGEQLQRVLFARCVIEAVPDSL